MAFWNKKEPEPWDRPEKEETVNSFQEYVDQWNAVVEKEKAEQAAEKKAREDYENALFESVSSMDCPWCGKDMEWGCISGGRDSVSWKNWRPRGLGIMRPEGWKEIELLDEGERAPYKTVWFCDSCGKMVLDVPKPAGRSYTREDGKVKQPEEE